MPDITIPTSELQGLVGKAILDSLSADTKETILAAAIDYLIAPREFKGDYGRTETKPSPLQLAFNRAVESLAHDVARELAQEIRPRLALEMRHLLAELPESLENDWEIYSKLFGVLVGRAADLAAEKRALY